MDTSTEPQRHSIAGTKQQQKESIWQSADIDTKEILRQLLLSNPWPELITYDGPACSCNAEDRGASSSSCALISMFCARTILDLEKQLRAREYRSEGRSKEDEASGLLDDILAERTVQRIVSIGQHLKGALRMSPSELMDVPMFERVFVSSSGRIKDFTCYESILNVLDQLCKDSVRRKIASAVITHGGESVVCVKLCVLDEDLFLLFDPHRRDEHPNGPSFMLSRSRITTATFLNCVFSSPQLDSADVTGFDVNLDACPTSADRFIAHLLDAKESYYKITAYQNEQTLRDSFLCAYEEVLSASIDYVNLSTLDVGPSYPRSPSIRFAGSISSSASTSSSASSSSDSNTHPLPPLPPSISRTVRIVSDPWVPDTLSFLEWQLKNVRASHQNPMSFMKPTFDCAVCLETVSVNFAVPLSGCEHRFCKDCLKCHVQGFLDNGRYPIQCPVCLLDHNVPDPGSVTQDVFDKLQLPEDCTDKFQELQILQYSVRLECPKCSHSDFMNRKEYLLAKLLLCNASDCRSKWCKFCSKVISDAKGKHSCKGDPFEKLMKKKGWRHCPGCTMPVVKDYGCNHMACTAPGCHSHFCYKCGKLIIQSSTGRNVGEEVTLHYTTGGCTQFERRWKCSIQ